MSLLLTRENKVADILQIVPVFKPVSRMITVLYKQDTHTKYQCKCNTQKLHSNLVISISFTKLVKLLSNYKIHNVNIVTTNEELWYGTKFYRQCTLKLTH
jgi:hypothetical protein